MPIVWLRSILISAQVSLFCYALMQGHNLVAFWNFIFVGINVVQVIRIMRERKPIEIDPELVDLYKTTFHSMTPREFVYFWGLGQIKEAGADVHPELDRRIGQEFEVLRCAGDWHHHQAVRRQSSGQVLCVEKPP